MSGLRYRDNNDNVYCLKDDPRSVLKGEPINGITNSATRPTPSTVTVFDTDSLTPDLPADMPDTEENALLDLEIEEKNPYPRSRKIALFCVVVVLLFVAGVILGYCLGRKHFTSKEENIAEELENCHHNHDTIKDALSSPKLLMELHQSYLREINFHSLSWLR